MMQGWFNYPKFRAQTALGLPLNGGLLYFYESGGAYSVLKDTYSDSAKTVAHTNPIVLDANGEALIYMTGVYDVRLTDSVGVLQWTVDDVEGINAFSFSTWEVDALTSYGAGTSYTKATIDAALAALGGVSKYTLCLRPGTWAFTVAADYSAYTNITFQTSPGTLITSTSTIKFPDGVRFYLCNFSSLQAAIALLSTTKCTLVVDRDYTMTANAIVPATMVLEFQNGAQITHTGFTLTYAAGATIHAPRVSIYSGTGTVVGPSGEVPLEWNNAGVSLSVAAKIETYIIDEDDMASDSATKVPTQHSVKAYVTASAPITILIGTVIIWVGDTAPSGYLECDGSSLDTTTYADLYAILGVVYGNADGTHFNLPDFRGNFLRGWAHGEATDPDRATRTDRGDATVGDNVGTKQDSCAVVTAHTHTVDPVIGDGNGPFSGSYNGVNAIPLVSLATLSSPLNTVTSSTSSAGVPTETRPINTNVMFCIKY